VTWDAEPAGGGRCLEVEVWEGQTSLLHWYNIRVWQGVGSNSEVHAIGTATGSRRDAQVDPVSVTSVICSLPQEDFEMFLLTSAGLMFVDLMPYSRELRISP
jgi:hypothetical protein